MSDASTSEKISAALSKSAPKSTSWGWLIRASVVAALTLTVALYAFSQYGEPLGRVAQKMPIARDFMALIAPAAILPAIVLAPLIAFMAELLFVGWDKSSLRKLVTGNRNSLRDGLYTIFAFLPIQFAVKVIFTFGIFYVADRHIAPMISWKLTSYLPTWPLQYVGVVLAGSFFHYWQHRILHIVPFLWETHKLHHSATEMNVLNLNRESPFTTGVADILIFIPLAIFGTQEMTKNGGSLGPVDLFFMAVFFSYSVFNVVNHYLIHSEIRSTYGWFGDWVFISPSAHRVHHSLLPQYWNKNFSVSLIIWDRVFGTYQPATGEEAANTPIGYSDNIYNRESPLLDYFWLPFREFVRALTRLVCDRVRSGQ